MESAPHWNVPTSPRFTLSHVLGKRYCVVEELRCGHAFQILRALDVVTESIKIVKVLSRSLVDDEVISDNVEWLRRRRDLEARHAELTGEFKTPFNWYLIFESPGLTLKDILAREDMRPLPRRHVRAITHQLIRAVSSLHRRGMMHLDICPATVELIDAVTVREWQYDLDGRFVEKVVLQCSRIRLVFYGSAGVRSEKSVGTDQYRAPELVFGWASKFRTDAFSVGCVLFEMLVGRPLLPPCHGEHSYVVAKAHLFQSALGEFPADIVYRVSLMHEGIFNSSDELRGYYDLSPGLRRYLDNAEPIQEIIEDEEELELVKALTMISSMERAHLSHVLGFTFFSRIE
ncbi:hypothetical protein CVT26_007108 [Gymnopilus dilepis]|uniref:Protein kinase domain-containing protein n=1 Tax=Gymnopilus dilepis TaxID=231916 RepID=A0A409WTF3_9AGAR|nr:hypothetical protein CVT26_007108 [Gymnopilus dilepis]